MWVPSLGQEGLLEKGMATHSSILAWTSPWTAEPSGPQSIESQSGTGLKGHSKHTQHVKSLALKLKVICYSMKVTKRLLLLFFTLYLFLAVLGLWSCWDSSLAMESGDCYLVVAGCIFTAVSSLLAEHGLQGTLASVVTAPGLSSCSSQALEHRLSTCGTRAQLFHGMWDLCRPGLKPVSFALHGRFFTTQSKGKPRDYVLR